MYGIGMTPYKVLGYTVWENPQNIKTLCVEVDKALLSTITLVQSL